MSHYVYNIHTSHFVNSKYLSKIRKPFWTLDLQSNLSYLSGGTEPFEDPTLCENMFGNKCIVFELRTKTNRNKVTIFIYLGFYVTINTVQVILRWVVGKAEETSTYSLSGICNVNCQRWQATTSFPT